MSNLWIKSDVDVDDHPKTYQLAAILNVRLPEAIGLLHCTWHFTLKYAWRDADLSKFGIEAIARGAKWHGEAQQFINAMQEAGWFDGLIVHDWIGWAGKIVTDRLYNESRRSTPSNDVERRPTTIDKSREEKSREDKKREEKVNTGAARFVKPSKKEIETYALSIGFKLDGQRFLDHYDSNGWKIGGKSSMKDWQAAIRNWKTRNGETNGNGSHGRIKNQSVNTESGKYAGIAE